ncbi:MAG: SDR family NAD(P)-dependent oxidoreductase [Betaproteobacteria bacterium]
MTEVRQISPSRLLLFGGTGSIGAAISRCFQEDGWEVVIVSRQNSHETSHVSWDPSSGQASSDAAAMEILEKKGPFDAVCWAQGMNCTDSVYDFDIEKHEAVYRANVIYILNSLQRLLAHKVLRKPARLCVISSIWQDIARQKKLSYCVTKAALHGLVLSAAADLASEGHVINAVMPGVIDTPMTRANLGPEQVRKVEDATLFARLPTLEEVATCVYGLCASRKTAVTGQFIAVDLGFSSVRIL